jgi:hypothetical protein
MISFSAFLVSVKHLLRVSGSPKLVNKAQVMTVLKPESQCEGSFALQLYCFCVLTSNCREIVFVFYALSPY